MFPVDSRENPRTKTLALFQQYSWVIFLVSHVKTKMQIYLSFQQLKKIILRFMLCKGTKVHFFNGLTQVLILSIFFFFIFETVRFLFLTSTVSNYVFKTKVWSRHNLQDLEIWCTINFMMGRMSKGQNKLDNLAFKLIIHPFII